MTRGRRDWSGLPAGLVGLIATCGGLSLREVRRMRCTCRAWKEALPEMGGPWLVLSPAGASNKRLSFWAISPDSGVLAAIPAWSPPLLATCWGSCDDALALRYGDALFLYHPLGCQRRYLHPLPHGKTPERLVVSEVDHWGRMRCAVFSPESKLYVADGGSSDEDEVLGADGWIEQPSFSGGVKSIEFGIQDSIHVANSQNKVEIDVFLGDPATVVAELGDMEPWPDNGHHLFLLNGQVHMCAIGNRKDDGQAVARLFAVVQDEDFQFHLEPRDTLLQNCLFLGQNQSIVFPLEAAPVGSMMRTNTVYIEDNSGSHRNSRILMINITTQQVEAIPFPPHIAADIELYGSATWIWVWHMRDRV